ncbi:hypothetical protein PPL_10548 [Heterostelium album PN500]|uniref:Uncharacterized protein n=1 Tax=Heterostelium pallidum (strain ATCC 26659 / Pp 5 / PN500) TaxID=670386 RepID=D3BRE0_HETP5|nr:hypothetical protein PPL_10548 [Heterostelium album PN500]EFA75972.1 hypothetical protein PPL_10548 [Heterostelium album PN500]|eukprot:XP_020428106.1 hypothetical protein PPL_10548 [Heterostelium album PN500]
MASFGGCDIGVEVEGHLSSRFCPISEKIISAKFPIQPIFPSANSQFNQRLSQQWTMNLQRLSIPLGLAPYIVGSQFPMLENISVSLGEREYDLNSDVFIHFLENNRQVKHLSVVIYGTLDVRALLSKIPILKSSLRSFKFKPKRSLTVSRLIAYPRPAILFDVLEQLDQLEHLEIKSLGNPNIESPFESKMYYQRLEQYVKTAKNLKSFRYSEELSTRSPKLVDALLHSNIDYLTIVDGIPFQYITAFQRPIKEMIVCIDNDILDDVPLLDKIYPLFDNIERLTLVVRGFNEGIAKIIATVITNRQSKYLSIRLLAISSNPSTFHTISLAIINNTTLKYFNLQMETNTYSFAKLKLLSGLKRSILHHPSIIDKNSMIFTSYIYKNIITFLWNEHDLQAINFKTFQHKEKINKKLKSEILESYRSLLRLDLVSWQFHALVKQFNNHLNMSMFRGKDMGVVVEEHLSSRFCPISDRIISAKLPFQPIFPSAISQFNQRLTQQWTLSLQRISIPLDLSPYVVGSQFPLLENVTVYRYTIKSDIHSDTFGEFLQNNQQIKHLSVVFYISNEIEEHLSKVPILKSSLRSFKFKDSNFISVSRKIADHPAILFDVLEQLDQLEHLEIKSLGKPTVKSPFETDIYYQRLEQYVKTAKNLKSFRYSEELSRQSPKLVDTLIHSNIDYLTIVDGIPFQYITAFQRPIKEMIVYIDNNILDDVPLLDKIYPLFDNIERLTLVIRDFNEGISKIIATVITNRQSKYLSIRLLAISSNPSTFHTISHAIVNNVTLKYFSIQVEANSKSSNILQLERELISGLKGSILHHPSIVDKITGSLFGLVNCLVLRWFEVVWIGLANSLA